MESWEAWLGDSSSDYSSLTSNEPDPPAPCLQRTVPSTDVTVKLLSSKRETDDEGSFEYRLDYS